MAASQGRREYAYEEYDGDYVEYGGDSEDPINQILTIVNKLGDRMKSLERDVAHRLLDLDDTLNNRMSDLIQRINLIEGDLLLHQAPIRSPSSSASSASASSASASSSPSSTDSASASGSASPSSPHYVYEYVSE